MKEPVKCACCEKEFLVEALDEDGNRLDEDKIFVCLDCSWPTFG